MHPVIGHLAALYGSVSSLIGNFVLTSFSIRLNMSIQFGQHMATRLHAYMHPNDMIAIVHLVPTTTVSPSSLSDTDMAVQTTGSCSARDEWGDNVCCTDVMPTGVCARIARGVGTVKQAWQRIEQGWHQAAEAFLQRPFLAQ